MSRKRRSTSVDTVRAGLHAAADILMKVARGGVHDDGSVNDLDPAADILRERLVFLGTQAIGQVHPVRQGSHRIPPFLAHCQANGNWWQLLTVRSVSMEFH